MSAARNAGHPSPAQTGGPVDSGTRPWVGCHAETVSYNMGGERCPSHPEAPRACKRRVSVLPRSPELSYSTP